MDDKLNNIKKEDITEASENIKQMFLQNNNKSSNLICDMINDISSELSNMSGMEGKGIGNILKIAENIANKFKPKIEADDFDLSELLGSAQNVMGEIYKDEKNNIQNPMNMLGQLMNSLSKNENTYPSNTSSPDLSGLLSQLNDPSNTSPPELSGLLSQLNDPSNTSPPDLSGLLSQLNDPSNTSPPDLSGLLSQLNDPSNTSPPDLSGLLSQLNDPSNELNNPSNELSQSNLYHDKDSE
jgi:hypothetical protein